MIKEAIILAGGLGTRLSNSINNLPKCMAPVNGIPFINFVISYLKNEGVERFILSLGYKSEIIIEHVSKKFKDCDIEFVVEKEQVGTGGAIKLAFSKVIRENVLVLNGDTIFNIDIKYFSAFHLKNKADISVALKEMNNFSRYGSVEIDDFFLVKTFNEKKKCNKGYINGGVYALNKKSFLQENFSNVFSFEKDILEKSIGNKKIYGLPCEYYFIDIGIPEDYKKFIKDYNLILSKNKYHNTSTADNLICDFFFDGLTEFID